MNVVEKGNPDKIKAIKEKRERAKTPLCFCQHCDATLVITKSDVVFENISGEDRFYITCPECESRLELSPGMLPEGYRKPMVLVGLPWHDVPGANCPVPTPPVPGEYRVIIGDPPPNQYPHTTCSDGVIPLTFGESFGVIPLTFENKQLNLW